jgi:glycerol-3-phosphate dehydrogenase
MLGEARFASDMGRFFGPLSEREINYLKAEEWVQEADDILWRRSKLGLHLTAAEQADLRSYMKPQAASRKSPAMPKKRKKAKPHA